MVLPPDRSFICNGQPRTTVLGITIFAPRGGRLYDGRWVATRVRVVTSYGATAAAAVNDVLKISGVADSCRLPG
jgi:hypothetical protein